MRTNDSGKKSTARVTKSQAIKIARKAMLATTARSGMLADAAKKDVALKKKRAAASDKGLANRGTSGAGKIGGAARATVQSDAGLANRAGISKPKPKVRAKGLKNRAGINAYAKSTAARKSDAGLTNRAGMAKSQRGQVMSERQRNWDVKGMKASNKMGIYKDAITKANAIKNAEKRDSAQAGRGAAKKATAAKARRFRNAGM